jgi:LytS/YehU family sensor histidine kinase
MKGPIASIGLRLLVWIAITIFLFVPSSYFLSTTSAIIASSISATLFVAIALTNEFWLFPKFYMTNRKKFIVVNIIVTLVFTCISLFMDHFVVPHEPKDNIRDIPFIFPVIRSFTMVMFVNFVSITLLLANALKSNAEREKQLKEEKLGTEIKLLKAQINPHFIFNALNNIYSLTYTKSEMAPESILKLSEMLRYVFYDCSNDLVKLGAEIEYISNFIAFQQMKSEHDQNIQFNFEGINKDFYIAPMLFISFIENSFKYSKIEEYIDAYVKINLKMDDNFMKLEIINSIPHQGRSLGGNGLGINNVRQRLDLLYLNRYDLDINDEDNEFTVNLEITL